MKLLKGNYASFYTTIYLSKQFSFILLTMFPNNFYLYFSFNNIDIINNVMYYLSNIINGIIKGNYYFYTTIHIFKQLSFILILLTMFPNNFHLYFSFNNIDMVNK